LGKEGPGWQALGATLRVVQPGREEGQPTLARRGLDQYWPKPEVLQFSKEFGNHRLPSYS